MKLSVIVPIYNAEKHLKYCIDSILTQNLEDLEVLLIDDGSTDRSLSICREYEKKDKRVKVIHQENIGQSGARNRGLECAVGTYISFVDADDRLVKGALRELAKKALEEEYDIVAGGYYRIERKASIRKKLILQQEGIVSRNGTKEEQIRYHKYKTTSTAGYVWGKLYKSEFLRNNNLWFDDIKKVFMEDTLFNTKVFTYMPKYYVMKEPVYCYYIYESSFSHGKEENVSSKYMNMMKELERFLEEKNEIEENIDLFAGVAARTFCWSVVKNIPYTGLSFWKIYKEIVHFTKADYIKKLVRNRNAYISMKYLSNPLEGLFYSLCFFMIRLHMSLALALIFTLTYPLQKRYIRNNVK